MLDRSENIVLWGRGTYLHRDLMDLNLDPLEKIYDAIRDAMQNIEKKTTATAMFDRNKALMAFMKIPTPQALYSVLRMNDDHRFLYRKYPDIEHTENADKARKERDDELNEFFLNAARPLYKDELIEYFVKKRHAQYQIFCHGPMPGRIKNGWWPVRSCRNFEVEQKHIRSIDVQQLLDKSDPLILGEAIHQMKCKTLFHIIGPGGY